MSRWPSRIYPRCWLQKDVRISPVALQKNSSEQPSAIGPVVGSRSLQVIAPAFKLPHGVAVDAAGDVYVTDGGNDRVLKLAAGSSTQTVSGAACQPDITQRRGLPRTDRGMAS